MVGFIAGYLEQSFRLTFNIAAVGLGIAVVVCVPDWPFFNRHPLPWQVPVKALEGAKEGEGVVQGGEGTVARDVEVQEEVKEEVAIAKKGKNKKKKATPAK